MQAAKLPSDLREASTWIDTLQEQLEQVSRRSGALEEAAIAAAQEAAQKLAQMTFQRDTLADRLSKAVGEQLDSEVQLQALLAEQRWLRDELAMSEVQTKAAKASLQSTKDRCSSLQQHIVHVAWKRVCEEIAHKSATSMLHRQIECLQADRKDMSAQYGHVQSAKAFMERQGQEEVAEHSRTKVQLQQAEAKHTDIMSQLTDMAAKRASADKKVLLLEAMLQKLSERVARDQAVSAEATKPVTAVQTFSQGTSPLVGSACFMPPVGTADQEGSLKVCSLV